MQNRGFNDWLDSIMAGGPVTADSFMASAIGEIPLITERVRMPDPSLYEADPDDDWHVQEAIYRADQNRASTINGGM